MFDGLVYHFFEKRKEKKRNRFIDRFIYPIMILGPITVIPQILKVWVEKEVSGVSVISWAAFVLISAAWLTYGITHKDKIVIVVNTIYLIFNASVAIGALLFR